jgi:tetratricopeptide (TPR) repeat protein
MNRNLQMAAELHFLAGIEKEAFSGDREGAIADYTEAIRVNPNYFQAYYKRGLSRRRLEDYQGAIDDFLEVIRINPNDADAHKSCGMTKQLIDGDEAASPYFRKALELFKAQGNEVKYQETLEMIEIYGL